jgi:hypothetical protein
LQTRFRTVSAQFRQFQRFSAGPGAERELPLVLRVHGGRQPDVPQVVHALDVVGAPARAAEGGQRRMEIRTAMIPMTTSNPTSVNPRRFPFRCMLTP